MSETIIAPKGKKTAVHKPEPAKLPDGFILDKADPAVIAATLAEHLKLDEKAIGSTPIDQAVVLIDAHFKKTLDKTDGALARCNKCGGIGPSDEALAPACVYCGDTEGVESDDEETEAEEEEAVEGEETPEAEPTEEAVPDFAATAEPVKEEPKKPGKPSTALAKKSATAADLVPAGVTEDEMKKEVALFIRLKGEALGSQYDIGVQGRLIYEKKLWMAETVTSTAEDGTTTTKLKYRSFDAFCKEKLQFSAAHLYNLMDATATYSREQIVEFGMTKVTLTLGLPPEAQVKLLEAAKTHNWGKRTLAAKVQEEKAKLPDGGKRKTGRKEMPEGKGGGRAGKMTKAQKENLTIAAIAGKTLTMPCYRQPAKKGEKPTERATLDLLDPGVIPPDVLKALQTAFNAHPAIFAIELENKVQMTGSVTFDTEGRFQTKIFFRPIVT
jgi:hypothetical protein